MSNVTSLGRVQPLFKGDYNNLIAYDKLDVVLYNGNSYVSKVDLNTGHAPANNPSYWQLIAVKGDPGSQGITGSFGTPTASATSVGYDDDPSVVVTATGPDTAKIFNFDFEIPAGKLGFNSVSATAQGGAAGTQPQVIATLDTTDPDDRELQFAFTIPAASGEGVKKVDNELPDTSGEVSLYAVRYVAQNLTAEQKTQTLNNIGAQAAGSYISRPIDPGTNDVLKYNGTTWVAGSVNEVPSSGTTGNFLKKTANGSEWAAVREVPAGSSSVIGRYLQYTSNGMAWSSVQALPTGGSTGMPLVKNSNSNYDVTWGSIITDAEINEMMGISNS